MRSQRYSAVFFLVITLLALLFVSPAVERLLVLPRTDFYTEFWLLDSKGAAENYLFNISSNERVTGSLGIGNNIGYCAYYLVQVKFRNQTQSAADSFEHTASSLSSIYNMTVFVADREVWEMPISFSFNYTVDRYNASLRQVKFDTLRFNDLSLDIGKYTAVWDPFARVFFGNLFFELWIYNDSVGDFQYHDRYVGFGFNMTQVHSG